MATAAAVTSLFPVDAASNNVSKETLAIERMRNVWIMIDSIMGGTKTMREAGPLLLPKFPAETSDSYEYRKNTATMYPAYEHTVNVMAAKPFSRPIQVSEDTDAAIEEWLDNVDREGRNLDTFAAELAEVAIAYGQAHIFVDYPITKPGMTVADEKALQVRPYLIMVKPTQIVGFRSANGVATQVRFREFVSEDSGEFGAREVEQIRVLEPKSWSVWRKVKDARATETGWFEYDTGVNTLGEVPFVTIYARRTGFMTSKPPMLQLAYLNVKHWQSQSDQDTILHVARVPILTVAGVDDAFELTLGSKTATKLPVGATMGYTEHSGAAIGAGKVSLDDLKEEMRQAGSEMLVMRPGPNTRIEAAGESSASASDLMRMVEGMEDAFDKTIGLMAKWGGKPDSGEVTIFKEFGALALGEATAPTIIQAGTAGYLSKESTFEELQRRGVISADRSWEDEQARMEADGPPVGNIDPLTGLPYTKPAAPADPNAPKPKIDPHTGLPYDTPAPPKVLLDAEAKAAASKGKR